MGIELVFYAIGFALVMMLVVLWICLPFAVFGTKDKLDALSEEVQRTNSLLTHIANGTKPPAPPREP